MRSTAQRLRPPASARGFLLVVLAASLWGSDALFRRGLALELPASAVVLAEHVVLVAVTAPLLVRGLRRAAARFSAADWLAMLIIGAGASALATVLFTAAFSYGDPTTPLLLQKLQPLVAVGGAHVLLGERVRSRYLVVFLVAIGGSYLVAFADPVAVSVAELYPALLAVGAAVLWGLGTVFGRKLATKIGFVDLTALRFGFGLPTAALLVWSRGEAGSLGTLDARGVAAVLLLALVPGLAAILLYYRGLRATPASAATIAELAFVVASVSVNYVAFGTTLAPSQWLGLALLTGAITLLGWRSRRGPRAAGVVVPAAEPAPLASSRA